MPATMPASGCRRPATSTATAIADMIIGAPLNGTADPRAGAAYVIFGKADGFTDLDLAHLDRGRRLQDQGRPCRRLCRVQRRRRQATSMATASPTSSSAPIGNDSGGPNAGAAYVIFGKAGGFGAIDLTASAAADGFKIQGEAGDDWPASASPRPATSMATASPTSSSARSTMTAAAPMPARPM